MTKIKDGYLLFFEHFSNIKQDQLIEFGINSLIFTPTNIAKIEWENTKTRLHSNQEIFIRGYGRDAHATQLFFTLYKNLFGNNQIKKDPTNNANPSRLIQQWTKHSKTGKDGKFKAGTTGIQNFQISHIFGRTKNPYLFTAPWNIVLIPKIMDPFTGHESKGEIADLFSARLKSETLSRYKDLIENYNQVVNADFQRKLKDEIKKLKENHTSSNFNLDKFERDAINEFQPIND